MDAKDHIPWGIFSSFVSTTFFKSVVLKDSSAWQNCIADICTTDTFVVFDTAEQIYTMKVRHPEDIEQFNRGLFTYYIITEEGS